MHSSRSTFEWCDFVNPDQRGFMSTDENLITPDMGYLNQKAPVYVVQLEKIYVMITSFDYKTRFFVGVRC